MKPVEKLKAQALEKLKDFPRQAAAVDSLAEELRRLELEATSVKPARVDGAPVRGSTASAREDRLLSNLVRREEVQRMQERAKLACSVVQIGLQALEDDERHLLEAMYIHTTAGRAERLADELGLADSRSVYKRTENALHRFTIALYGATEL